MPFALVLLLLAASQGQRTTVSIDFGWRVSPAPTPKCNYSFTLPGIVQTAGWQALEPDGTPANVSSPADCHAAACAAKAQAWSYCSEAGKRGNCTGGHPELSWLEALQPPYCILVGILLQIHVLPRLLALHTELALIVVVLSVRLRSAAYCLVCVLC